MKKILAFILACLYISASIGAVVHTHYCMGQLAAADFNQTTSASCSNCGMEKKDTNHKSCCTDEHKLIKNSPDQKTVDVSFLQMQASSIDLPVSYISSAMENIISIAEKNPDSHAPLRSSGQDVYIRNCVFLI